MQPETLQDVQNDLIKSIQSNGVIEALEHIDIYMQRAAVAKVVEEVEELPANERLPLVLDRIANQCSTVPSSTSKGRSLFQAELSAAYAWMFKKIGINLRHDLRHQAETSTSSIRMKP